MKLALDSTREKMFPALTLLCWLTVVVLVQAGWVLSGAVAEVTPVPATAPVQAGAEDYGTVAAVDASGVISLIPWGKKAADAKPVATTAQTAVSINLESGKVADLKEGMWIKVLEREADGKARRVIAGQYLQEEGDKIIIFKGLPEEFLVYRSEGWYTNTVAGVEFKVQPMGAGKEPSNPGTNLRAAKYQGAGRRVCHLLSADSERRSGQLGRFQAGCQCPRQRGQGHGE